MTKLSFNKGLVTLGAISIMLGACSSNEQRKLANGGYDYLEKQERVNLVVPEGADQPKFDDRYNLPELGENAPRDLIGSELTVRSPTLVLPLVRGSHIEEGSQQATIWFDQVDDSQALDTTIWNSLINFLEEKGVAVESFNKDEKRLITGWVVDTIEESTSWYTWSDKITTISRRFEFNLDMKPHGRTASLSSTLIGYKESESSSDKLMVNAEMKRRNEASILNEVVGHYEHQIRLDTARKIREIRSGLVVELGFDSNGEAAFMVDAEYDVAWPRLLLVLRKLGFDVKDLDKSNGLMFVKYNGPDTGWWDGLWNSDKDALDLDNDEYRLHVDTIGEKTTVTLLDEESKAFTVDKVTSLFPVFSRTMAAADLDI